MSYLNKNDAALGNALAHAYDLWAETTSLQNVSNNIFVDVINAIFGTNGLFDMSKNQSQQIHPLAQLAAAGRGILESAVRNLGWAGAAGLGGGLINIEQDHLVGTAGMAVSGFLWSFALTGLSIGFVMFYIIPFLPFIYFFFAVGSWIKTIFEAMVGVPLWAMAHLRIDGQGLPGDAAMGGYFLLLEIFLRPILIIFGMLGGIILFTAQASILNDIWSLVTSNITGFNRDTAAAAGGTQTGALTYLRDAVDQLFFSVIYAIMIYMLGTSTFKMVDQVPSYVLRWMGANVQTFTDQQGEQAASHLLQNSFVGSQTVSGVLERASPANLGRSISRFGQSFKQRNS
jgi:conjugal transfer/type IV secretion protein DotA/TraY